MFMIPAFASVCLRGGAPDRAAIDSVELYPVGAVRLDVALHPPPAVPVNVGQLHTEAAHRRRADHGARALDPSLLPRHLEGEAEVLPHLEGLAALQQQPVDAEVERAAGEAPAALQPPLPRPLPREA